LRKTFGDAFVISEGDGRSTVECVACGHEMGDAASDPKLGAVVSERSISELNPLNSDGMVDRLVVRMYMCPGCGLLFASEVQEKGDPILITAALTEGRA